MVIRNNHPKVSIAIHVMPLSPSSVDMILRRNSPFGSSRCTVSSLESMTRKLPSASAHTLARENGKEGSYPFLPFIKCKSLVNGNVICTYHYKWWSASLDTIKEICQDTVFFIWTRWFSKTSDFIKNTDLKFGFMWWFTSRPNGFRE